MKLLSVYGRHLEFRIEGITSAGWHGTVEKVTLENVGMAFGILPLGGTEPEIT